MLITVHVQKQTNYECCTKERPAAMIPEESSRERGSEKFELLKMSSENLEFPVKMWLHRKIKCKFKTTVGLIICNNNKKESS